MDDFVREAALVAIGHRGRADKIVSVSFGWRNFDVDELRRSVEVTLDDATESETHYVPLAVWRAALASAAADAAEDNS